MEHEPPSEVTQLLQVWRGGDRDALDALLPLVYKELRRVALLKTPCRLKSLHLQNHNR